MRLIGWFAAATAAAAAVVVHQRVPWIPVWYLVALVVFPAALWWAFAGRLRGRSVRWVVAGAASVAFVALCPVPWMQAQLDHPPGTAWQLDGQLVIDGETVDPPGDWYWLTAGRPPVVAEILRGWLLGGNEPRNLLVGRRSSRPVYVEPAAATVGLRRAGWDIESLIVVEVSEPTLADLPGRALLATINGSALTDRMSWNQAIGALGTENTLTTAAGETISFAGTAFPFLHIDVIEQPSRELDVTLGGRFASTLPVRWFRNLSVGSSDGLMIALASYVHASGHDLAAGRTIAGTGGIRGDGTVRNIGQLRSKAEAARAAGADVLLFPAALVADLDGFDPGSMRLLPVATLDEAIAALAAPAA